MSVRAGKRQKMCCCSSVIHLGCCSVETGYSAAGKGPLNNPAALPDSHQFCCSLKRGLTAFEEGQQHWCFEVKGVVIF